MTPVDITRNSFIMKKFDDASNDIVFSLLVGWIRPGLGWSYMWKREGKKNKKRKER